MTLLESFSDLWTQTEFQCNTCTLLLLMCSWNSHPCCKLREFYFMLLLMSVLLSQEILPSPISKQMEDRDFTTFMIDKFLIFSLWTSPKLLPGIQYMGGLQLAKHDLFCKIYTRNLQNFRKPDLGWFSKAKQEWTKQVCLSYLLAQFYGDHWVF